MMEPRIETIPEKKLVGMSISMSLTDNRTYQLWSGFMPRRKEITNRVGEELYSLRKYDPLYFTKFQPETSFEKWATVEVTDFAGIPEGMETTILPTGLYAVFHYKGAASAAGPTYQHIYTEWLPNSPYLPDDRPHFEIMGAMYKHEHPESEEDIWIPIRPK